MSIGLLTVLVIQCFMFAAIYVLWIRLNKAPEDDPRLTKGLQLLQSKIAVLEDLSDRTETQVNQLTALMENKIKEIQIKIIDADKIISHIEVKIQKSMEVAKIFQDKIPHQEILDRQYTIKYVRAAKLAHQGMSTEEIAKEVDLTMAEIELILKLNKEELMFSAEELPAWADSSENLKMNNQSSQWIDFEKAFEVPRVDQQNLKKLGDQFKEALATHNEKHQPSAPVAPTTINTPATVASKPVANLATNETANKLVGLGAKLLDGGAEAVNQRGKVVNVKPFEFKRIDSDSMF